MDLLLPPEALQIVETIGDKSTRIILSVFINEGDKTYNDAQTLCIEKYKMRRTTFKYAIQSLLVTGFIEKKHQSTRFYKFSATKRGRDILSYLRNLVKFT